MNPREVKARHKYFVHWNISMVTAPNISEMNKIRDLNMLLDARIYLLSFTSRWFDAPWLVYWWSVGLIVPSSLLVDTLYPDRRYDYIALDYHNHCLGNRITRHAGCIQAPLCTERYKTWIFERDDDAYTDLYFVVARLGIEFGMVQWTMCSETWVPREISGKRQTQTTLLFLRTTWLNSRIVLSSGRSHFPFSFPELFRRLF